MNLEGLFEQIDKATDETDFEDLMSKLMLSIKYSSVPGPPRTILEAYAYRHIAMNLNLESRNKDYKAHWANYWLNWCLKPQSKFFFAATSGLVDPEQDVMAIIDSKTLENELTDQGRVYYLRRVADWYLKRFNREAAQILLALIPQEHQSFLDAAKLGYPRLFGSVVIGFLPLISVTDLWKFPVRQPAWITTALAFFSLMVAFLYLRIEYVNTTGHTDTERPYWVLLVGVFYALSVSAGLTIFLGNHFLKGADSKACHIACGNGFSFYVSLWIFLASAALVIGIFVQSFWEEKTMTEPL